MPLAETEATGGRPKFAAVMGDLIGSEQAASARLLHVQFNAALAETSAQAKGVASPLTITLGDEFQGLFFSLMDGVKAIRFMRQRLLADGVRCRFALGIVELDSALNAERAWNMMGPGLSDIREKINDKKSPNAYRFYIPGRASLEVLLEAVGYSISNIEDNWTARQQTVLSAMFRDGSSTKAIARSLLVSERNVYKIRSSGHFDFLLSQWRAIESALADVDEGLSAL